MAAYSAAGVNSPRSPSLPPPLEEWRSMLLALISWEKRLVVVLVGLLGPKWVKDLWETNSSKLVEKAGMMDSLFGWYY